MPLLISQRIRQLIADRRQRQRIEDVLGHAYDGDILDRKPRKMIDIAEYKRLKRACQDKRRGVYKTYSEVARLYNVSPTTISFVNSTRSYKQYRERRKSL